MPEAQEKKPRTRKTATPPPAPPLWHRLQDDLTFRAESTDTQSEAWRWVKDQFTFFRRFIFNTLENSPVDARFTEMDEFVLYKYSIREAERWANAAIARDMKADFVFDPDSVKVPDYVIGIRANVSEREKLCYYVGKAIYEFSLRIAIALPDGRPLSCFATEIEVMRGWLMDCINTHADKDYRRKPKTHFNTDKIEP